MVITDLPAEIIDHIAAALDLPTDLRNLAAVCTQLRLLLEPHHTQFRVIRAPLISPIWKKIAENRLFAQNIRVLEIQSAETHGHHHGDAKLDRPVIPAVFRELEVPSVPVLVDDGRFEVDAVRRYDAAKNAMDLDAERILVSALKEMSGLTSFRWVRTPPLINRNEEDDIWITLAKYCTSLDVIDVLDREKVYERVLEETDDPAYQRPSLNPNFYSFKDIKSFSLYTEAFNVGAFPFPDVEQCAEMLIRKCPNLEVLNLQYILYANPNTNAIPASPFFSGPPWTSLRELTLSGLNFISTELASYLASHPTIEILSLRSSQIDQSLVLPPNVLPRLKRLYTDYRSTLANSILNSTISTPRPLEYIYGSSFDDLFLNSLEHSGSGPNLESLITVRNDDLNHLIARLSGIAPKLQWLNISRYRSSRTVDRSLYTLFGQFPHLRTIQGVRFLDSKCEPALENTESIRALVTACPNLRRISWYMGKELDYDSVVIIERNGSHVTWSVRKMLREVEGSVNPYWGERGCGSFQL